jgi:CelD/BcsL family acetyltransferase involved in cellulose biosynthesis
MVIKLHVISLAELELLHRRAGDELDWPQVFILPGWLDAWWRSFGANYQPLVLTGENDRGVVGVAPLKLLSGEASFMGDPSVCDYADFITRPGSESGFISAVLENIAAQGVKSMELGTLRPDSSARRFLTVDSPDGMGVECAVTDTSYEMPLAGDWDAYLASLESRQRRDIERKQRRLASLAEADFKMLRDDEVTAGDLSQFIDMMMASRSDKADFMTDKMKAFFEDISRAAAAYGILRLGFLGIGRRRIAAVMCFEYRRTFYLYNSGYLSEFAELSAGLFSKLYAIRYAISSGLKIFDFLKGAEPYKARLGGQAVGLYTCRFPLG